MNQFLPFLDSFFEVISEFLLQSENYESSEDTEISKSFRQQITKAILDFENSASEQLLGADLVAKTKYALIAFVDECAIRKGGNFGNEWMTAPLQLEFFQENTAGERFFTQLSSMRLQADKYIDVLEIYYLCLELGYEGQYRINGKHELLNLKSELLGQIQQVRNVEDLALSPPILEVSSKPLQRLKPMYQYVLVAAIIQGVAAIGLIMSINYNAAHHRKSLLDLQDRLKTQQQAYVQEINNF